MKRDPKLTTWILLANYSFDQGNNEIENIIDAWLSAYPTKWVIAAIVEAIYQGRYKVGSVSKILDTWAFRGYPTHHFDHEFADIVCKKLANCKNPNLFLVNKNIKMKTNHSKDRNLQVTDSSQENIAQGYKESCKERTPNPKIRNLEKLVVRLTA